MLAYKGDPCPPLGSAHAYVAGLELSRGMFDSCVSVLFRPGRIASEKRNQCSSLSYEVSSLEGASLSSPQRWPHVELEILLGGSHSVDVTAPFASDMANTSEASYSIPGGGARQPLASPASYWLGHLAAGCVGKLSMGQPITASGAYFDSPFAHDEVFESTLGQYSEEQTTAFLEIGAEVKSYLRLGPNWDMEGAAEIGARVVEKAISLLASASKLQDGSTEFGPLSSPMPDGQISFAWEHGSKELWISVGEAGFTSHRWGDKQQFRGEVSSWKDPEAIMEHLEWLKT